MLDCRYLVYLLFLAEGVSVLPDDQLEMVDQLVEKLQKDPEGGMQQIMKMIQESAADSMGDAGAASLTADRWGGLSPVDDLFASMAQGNPVDNFMDLKGIFLPDKGTFLPESRKAEEPPLLLAASQPSANRTAYLPDGPSDSATLDSP